MDQALVNFFEKINDALSGIFFLEMIIMLIGLGFKQYINDNFNIFDALVVLVSMLDIAIK